MDLKEFHRMPQNQKEEIMREISDFLERQENITFAYVFGSFTDKENISFRDIDIGVFLNAPIFEKNGIPDFEFEFDLTRQISREVSLPIDVLDIKILNFAPNNFLANIFSRGTLLFSKNDKILSDLIEKTSLERLSNEYIISQSFKELTSVK